MTETNNKDLSFKTEDFKRVVNLEDYTTIPFGYQL
jgi:hypothetical protein